jgi:hypothetical protein
VILIVALGVFVLGIVSIVRRGPLAPAEELATAGTMVHGTALDPTGVAMRTEEPEASDGPEEPGPGARA